MTLPHPPLSPASSTAERARDLLGRMTLAEKIAQLGSTWPGSELAEGDVAPMQETHLRAEPFDEAVVDGLGHLTRVYGTAPVSAEEGRRRLDELQDAVISGNRWGIPAIAHEECLTGVTAWGATVYPTPLAWAASFDPDTVRRMGARIGGDLRDLGVHQGLAPVLDVVRDYRWGRVEETMGEDPHVVAEIGTAYVEGIESSGTVATPKHFAGYAASRGARNHAPVSIGPREFADVILPPFERALQSARSVMNSYTDVDGIPAAADSRLFTDLLRQQWGFDGTVVSDYWAIPFLHSMHRVAAGEADAGELALRAGIDVELPHRMSYLGLREAVETGRIPESLVDRAAERVLRQKIELGLLDAAQPTTTAVDLDSAENRVVARTLAERSIVLVRNEGVLPLRRGMGRIAVIGPTADDSACLFGCYSFPNHVLVHHPDTPLGVDAPTYLDALFETLDDADITPVPGTSIRGGETDGIPDAVAAAAAAEVAIVFVGDRSGMFGLGTSGEGCDVASLELPGAQQQLVDAVLDTGTPVVLIVSSGRPYALGRAVDEAAAIVQAFLPGQEGALALADVLTGRVSPSGRLPVQIPTLNAPQPGTYLAPPLALRSDGVSNLDPSPAFPFGHGLSYTAFARTIVDADTSTRTEQGADVTLRVEVSNTGQVRGADVVQVYVGYDAPSVVQPVRRLVAFQRVEMDPNESRTIEFRIPVESLAFTGIDLKRAVEPGILTLTVAESASDEGMTREIELIGDRVASAVPRRRFAAATVRSAR